MLNADNTFDYEAQSLLIKAYLAAKMDHKSQRDTFKLKEGKLELAMLAPALEYASQTFDLQPLAFLVHDAKPSAAVKRIIKAVFPTYSYGTLEGKNGRRPAMVHDASEVKTFDTALMAVVLDAFWAGDSVNCDQIKKAFPAPDATKVQAMDKLGKALAARMKSDGLSKEDILTILKGL
jgi:hypothetical protein